jgi:hypothetical protein
MAIPRIGQAARAPMAFFTNSRRVRLIGCSELQPVASLRPRSGTTVGAAPENEGFRLAPDASCQPLLLTRTPPVDDSEIPDWYDNRALARRETPRLNSLRSEVRQLTLELGGRREVIECDDELGGLKANYRDLWNHEGLCNSQQSQLRPEAGPFTRPLPGSWDRQARRICSRPCRPSCSSPPIGSSHPCFARRRMTFARWPATPALSACRLSHFPFDHEFRRGAVLRRDVDLPSLDLEHFSDHVAVSSFTPSARVHATRNYWSDAQPKGRNSHYGRSRNAGRWQPGLRRMCPPDARWRLTKSIHPPSNRKSRPLAYSVRYSLPEGSASRLPSCW